jgi:hypothetical protein
MVRTAQGTLQPIGEHGRRASDAAVVRRGRRTDEPLTVFDNDDGRARDREGRPREDAAPLRRDHGWATQFAINGLVGVESAATVWPSGHGETLLVVEDDYHNAEIIPRAC